MKKLLYLLIPIVFAACNGGDNKPGTTLVTQAVDTTLVIDTTIIEPGVAPLADLGDALSRKVDKADKQKKEKISCSFGFKKFNNRKRPVEEAPGGKKGKPVKPGTEPPPPPPPTGGSTNVIYINFFGKTIANTMWNVNGTFTVQDAGLAQSEIDYVMSQVKLHYVNYNVTVTQDKAIFDAAPIGHKIEVVVTEDYQWYGQAGGVAYLNSFFWGDGSPAFVFSLLLNYSAHSIGEAVAHEAGHSLGLRHQSLCDAAGNLISQYNWGVGDDAPTMGASYNVSTIGLWYPDGPTPIGCTYRQNDPAILQASVGLKQ